jgi:lipopolysaccharide export system permease protein
MNFAVTLSVYISRQFMAATTAMLMALSGLVAMFDFIELLRRSTSYPDATFGLVSQIAALRLPYIAMQILPFAVLLGGIMCFWRLTRSSELVIARASGISAWEFLAAPTLCALLFGAIATAAISPVSSVMLARAEALDNAYLRTGGGPLALNGGELWLRQADRALNPQGIAIIHAHGVEMRGKQLTAREVSVFRLDGSDHLLSRIEATRAVLSKGAWQFDNARAIRPD